MARADQERILHGDREGLSRVAPEAAVRTEHRAVSPSDPSQASSSRLGSRYTEQLQPSESPPAALIGPPTTSNAQDVFRPVSELAASSPDPTSPDTTGITDVSVRQISHSNFSAHTRPNTWISQSLNRDFYRSERSRSTEDVDLPFLGSVGDEFLLSDSSLATSSVASTAEINIPHLQEPRGRKTPNIFDDPNALFSSPREDLAPREHNSKEGMASSAKAPSSSSQAATNETSGALEAENRLLRVTATGLDSDDESEQEEIHQQEPTAIPQPVVPAPREEPQQVPIEAAQILQEAGDGNEAADRDEDLEFEDENGGIANLIGLNAPFTSVLVYILWMLAFNSLAIGVVCYLPWILGCAIKIVGSFLVSNFRGQLDAIAKILGFALADSHLSHPEDLLNWQSFTAPSGRNEMQTTICPHLLQNHYLYGLYGRSCRPFFSAMLESLALLSASSSFSPRIRQPMQLH